MVVFKLYLQLENVVKVTETVNDLGFRIKTNTYARERKYSTNDITSIITDPFANVVEDLKILVQDRQRKIIMVIRSVFNEWKHIVDKKLIQ